MPSISIASGQGEVRSQAAHRFYPPTEFVVLLLANLAPHKGQATAIRALHALKQRGSAVECWLAGEDRSGKLGYEDQLRRLIADLDVADAVRFLGFRSDAPDLLRAADVLVLPSTHEGLPLSVLEAQANALAGDRIADTRNPRSNRGGRNRTSSWRQNDHATYADRIQMLMEQPQRRHQLGAAGAARSSTRLRLEDVRDSDLRHLPIAEAGRQWEMLQPGYYDGQAVSTARSAAAPSSRLETSPVASAPALSAHAAA
jgi:glycosyltransferase involved in cell wall biosynthesis